MNTPITIEEIVKNIKDCLDKKDYEGAHKWSNFREAYFDVEYRHRQKMRQIQIDNFNAQERAWWKKALSK